MLVDIVGKEENFQDGKDDEELDENDGPEGFPQCHIAESFIVQVVGSVPETIFSHRQNRKNVFKGKDSKKFINDQTCVDFFLAIS